MQFVVSVQIFIMLLLVRIVADESAKTIHDADKTLSEKGNICLYEVWKCSGGGPGV